MKNKYSLWIIGIILVIAVIYSQADIGIFATNQNPSSMIRQVPSSANPNSEFKIKYKAIGGSGKWGASIEDSVSGGCSFPAGNSLKTVMLSDEGTTKTITITTPSSGLCTFSGDYKFGTDPVEDFSDKTVTISSGGNGNGNGDGNGNGNGDGNGGEVPSFDLNKVLFEIGGFEVTLLMLLIAGGILLLLVIIKK